jgi:hypothetical protein
MWEFGHSKIIKTKLSTILDAFFIGAKSSDVLKKLGEWINRWINRPTKV